VERNGLFKRDFKNLNLALSFFLLKQSLLMLNSEFYINVVRYKTCFEILFKFMKVLILVLSFGCHSYCIWEIAIG